jgi:hypothetical protein
MYVRKLDDGKWGIFLGLKSKVMRAGPFDTNADAWRWLDRVNGEPISRAEKVAEFIWESRD